MSRISISRRSSSRPPRKQGSRAGPAVARRLPGAGPGGLVGISQSLTPSLELSMGISIAGPGAAPVSAPAAAAARALDPSRGLDPAAQVAEASRAASAGAAAAETLAAALPAAGAAPDPAPEASVVASAPLVLDGAAAGAATEIDLDVAANAAAPAAPEARAEAAAGREAAATPAETASGNAAATPPAETELEAPAEPSPQEAVAPAAAAVGRRAVRAGAHQPAAAAAGGAVAASNSPGVTAARMAEGSNMAAAGTAAAGTGGIDSAAFKRQLQDAIARAMPTPRTEAQARDVIDHGGDRAAAAVQLNLGQQRTNAVGQLPASVAAEPVVDPATGGAEVPLVPEEAGPPPDPVSAGPVVPPASRPEAIDTRPNREGVDALQAENNITKERMAKGNDPQFTAMIGAQDEAEAHDREAPRQLREAEAVDRQATRERAQGAIDAGLTDFQSTRASQLGEVARRQADTKGLTEARKAEITADIAGIGRRTREDVAKILDGMDAKVSKDFGDAIERALTAYEDAFDEEQGGFLTSVGDFFTGDWWNDDRLNRALRYGRDAFDREISSAIDAIAVYVAAQLNAARARVKEGRDEVQLYLTQRITDAEREFAEGAATSITSEFDTMEGEISSRKDALVSRMVDMYKQGIERRNRREQELREANKSFWQRVWDATVGVVQKIIEFKNLLLGILGRAAGIIGAIIDDPIGFLRNLIAGIGAGLERFVANIAANLQQALMGWLFGALEGAGLRLPERFDLAGILDLVMQILGLTKENVRRRAVMILGEDVVSKIETAVDFLYKLFTEGPAAVWEMLLQQLGNLKDMILEEIKSWVITEIIEAGIKWILGLLNPAGAFVKACMAIYDIVMFFIERGRQIIDAVNAILDTLAEIVAGNISAMATKVEATLNRILPVVIGFLASLLGLGGISDAIRGIIEKIQEPVNKAIDWVINQGVKLAKSVAGLFGGKKEAEATDPELQAKIDAGLIFLKSEDQKAQENRTLSREDAEGVAKRTRQTHPVFKSIEVIDSGDNWAYHWRVNPEDTVEGGDKDEVGPDIKVGDDIILIYPPNTVLVTVTEVTPGESLSYLGGPGRARQGREWILYSYTKGTIRWEKYGQTWREVRTDADKDIQVHHKIPHTNKAHWDHPLRVLAQTDLKNDPRNLVRIQGHKGSHAESYHAAVTALMTEEYHALSIRDQASASLAMERVMSTIENRIKDHDLELYSDGRKVHVV